MSLRNELHDFLEPVDAATVRAIWNASQANVEAAAPLAFHAARKGIDPVTHWDAFEADPALMRIALKCAIRLGLRRLDKYPELTPYKRVLAAE